MKETTRIPAILGVIFLVLIAVFAIRKSESAPVPQNDSPQTMSATKSTAPGDSLSTLESMPCNDVSDCPKALDVFPKEFRDRTHVECKAASTDPTGPKLCFGIMDSGE